MRKSGISVEKEEKAQNELPVDGRKWMVKLKTECVFEDINPIFQNSITFNIFNYEAIKVRIDIY